MVTHEVVKLGNEKKNAPIAHHRAGLLSVAVWKNANEKGDWLSFSIQRSYKDEKTGEFKNTDSLRRADLLPLAEILREAFLSTRKGEME